MNIPNLFQTGMAFALLLAVTTNAQSGQVNFSGSMRAVYEDSTGAPLTGEFVFELGAFTPGFIPTTSNVADWKSNWTAIARAPLNESTKLFAGKLEINSNAVPFSTTNTGWIWGYRPMSGPNEWVLIGSSKWKWPSSNSVVPAFWSTSSASAVVGYLDPKAPRGQLHIKTAAVFAEPPMMDANAWLNLMFTNEVASENTGMLEDFDGDGVNNVLEFAFGTNPRSKASAAKPEFIFDSNAGHEYGALKISRNPHASINYNVEYSEDLKTWASTGLVKTKDNATELVVRDSLPKGERKNVFFRLSVEP